ncbi:MULTISPECIES: DUF29 domain-containing protein [unclassified Aureimonas]|uniref:DUF29 domain-containing protein n=1 Tax=unclassified Aureimonas TaxID=2615206 RepID=UPI0006FFAA3F|nr:MULTISPECIES: DUF29 domain-containing protein [unclassified Aureimonas]KQT69967.1 hypothetical protein ASG62_02405 [Aureimonas sp. Leaf427]KQT75877.1 hypothetical protein ASG54_13810 [Aureimonas sp. Leaf460]
MAPSLKTDSLYERDFFAWTQDQAGKLRARASFDNRGDVDWEHAAEEIESVGASEKREIRSRLRALILHLLKWKYQTAKRKSGWRSTIDEQRDRLAMVLEDSPSLAVFPQEVLAGAYRLAVAKALQETRLPASSFPQECPFTIGEILDPEFFPEGPLS